MLAGAEALQLEAALDTDDRRLLTWRGRTRGLWTLEAVWEVEGNYEARIAPI
jgi:hypothetical protein